MRSLPLSLVFVVVVLGALASGCRNQRGSVASCTPGESLLIACDDAIGVTCTGDPTLTICDASIISVPENCRSGGSGYLAFNDDSGRSGATLCPRVNAICPSSGSVSINPDPYRSGSTSWSCDYAIVRGGVGP